MPVWNKEKKRYDEEEIVLADDCPLAREERFRTALLNEIDALTHAVLGLDAGEGFKVNNG